jgi:hypothetical protein
MTYSQWSLSSRVTDFFEVSIQARNYRKVDMRKILSSGCLLLTGLGFSMHAEATYNATAVGTVGYLQQSSPSVGATPETFIFTISPQPSVSCGGFNYFIISPNSVTDAQTRKNMIALLLTAKASGSQVEVAYDSTGGFCDQGMIGVYYITVFP